MENFGVLSLAEVIITTRNMTNEYLADADYPQIVQAGFDKIRTAPPPLHVRRNEDVKRTLSFIYTAPQGMTLNQSISSRLQKKTVSLWPQSATFDTDFDTAGTTVKIERKSSNIGQTTLSIRKTSFYHYGDYHFTIEGRYENGSFGRRATHDFEMDIGGDIGPSYSESVKLPSQATTNLMRGTFYEIQMYLQSEEKFNKASIEVLRQDSRNDKCDVSLLLLGHEAFETCGVIAVSLISETANKSEIVGIQVIPNI